MAVKKIINPYVSVPEYNCFGCAPENPIGLAMEFFLDEERDLIFSHWTMRSEHQGYNGILHGGVQSTLMDEAASWYVFAVLGTSGVTKNLRVSFYEPVDAREEPLLITATIETKKKRVVTIRTTIALNKSQETILSEGWYDFGLFPEKMAREKFGYPGIENFFEK